VPVDVGWRSYVDLQTEPGVAECSWYVMAEDGRFGANGGVHWLVVAVLSSQRSSGRVRINTYR
jgi:hypothetical protein